MILDASHTCTGEVSANPICGFSAAGPLQACKPIEVGHLDSLIMVVAASGAASVDVAKTYQDSNQSEARN
jgi:hypothetical protein